MTLKSYLRMLLAAVTLMFVTTGCNDDEKKVGPPPSYTFGIAVSDVTETEATVTVTPSNDQATYYYEAVKKADFDAFESDAAYAQHILANLQAIADKKVLPLSEYLATVLGKGGTPQKITDLTPGTDYYAVALGMLTDGRLTSELVKEAFETVPAITKAGGYFFGTSFGVFDNFSLWMSEDGVTEDMTIFSGEGTYLIFDLNVTVTGKATLPAGTFPVASGSDAEENTIVPGADYAGGMMTGSAIVQIKEDGTKDYFYIDGGALTIESSNSSYTLTAKVTSNGKEYEFKYKGEVSIFDATGGGFELSIDVTNITATAAKVSVTSSDETSPYYFDLLDEEDYQLYGGTPEGIADFIKELWAFYQTKYPTMTLPQILSQIVSIGNDSYDFDGLTPAAKYYTFAIGVDATTGAATTTAVVKEFTTQAGGGGEGPELTLTMKAGDPDGANLTSAVTCLIQSPTAISGKGGMYLKANVDKALAEGTTIEEYLASDAKASTFDGKYIELINGAGLPFYASGLTPSLAVTAIISVTDANGNTTVKSASATTEAAQGGGDGPNLTITAIPGKEGADTQTYITAMFKVTGTPAAVSGSYILAEKALVDQLVAEKGLTYEQITEAAGNEFTADNLTKLNANGVGWYFKELTPGTEHIVMAKVTDAAGNSTFKYVLASTDPAGEASDAYKAWLGTWTLTSTSSEINKAPLSFDVTFVQGVANSSYKLQGWGITTLREQTEIVPSAKFDNATGNFEILEGQELYTDPEDGSVLTLTARGLLQGKYYIINGGYPGFTGALSADKNSATITMYQGTVDGLGAFTTSSMEFFWFHPNGEDIYGQKAAAGYTDGDYPIGPYTMTRKSSSASVSASKSANTILHASKLSSVLSAYTAVSTSVMQNSVVFESRVAMPISLVFNRPAAVYEATISNVANIEKPLGLKKHFIKK